MAASAITKNCKNIKQTISHELPKGLSIAIMAESEKGHNFAILDPTKTKKYALIFCTDAT